MMAVPCWSSCITGMFISSFRRRSISKHSGALISSRFTPPKVGSSALTMLTNSSTFLVSSSMSKTSMSANILNSKPFPSITGLPAWAPISPKPSTAVPLLITATKFPLEVYLYASSLFSAIAKQGSATPGEYANDRSRCEL